MSPKKPLNAATLVRLSCYVEARLDAIKADVGPYDAYDRTWHDRLQKKTEAFADELIEQEGLRVSNKPGWHDAVRMAGLRASSTGGLGSALRNWATAARRAVEEGRAQ